MAFDFDKIRYARNTIAFGAPGTGKSYGLEEERKKIFAGIDGVDEYFERVTFHPEYNYFKFVGSYKPVTTSIEGKEEISYKFVPGPFIRILVKALNNPNMPYLLLIEEINRANVAAVFGDVFQLLDRNDEGDSEYSVNASEDLKKYLQEHVNADVSLDKIYIPKNMYIWATMNSADQGVFPMDTAFKRRWEFEYIGIDDGEEPITDCSFEIAGYIYKWNDLRKSINRVLTDLNVNEDKLMGPFFLSKKILFDKSENASEKIVKAFKSKVLMYLFEDAAKQKRSNLFGKDMKRYSDICKAFDNKGIECFDSKVISEYKNYDPSYKTVDERKNNETGEN